MSVAENKADGLLVSRGRTRQVAMPVACSLGGVLGFCLILAGLTTPGCEIASVPASENSTVSSAAPALSYTATALLMVARRQPYIAFPTVEHDSQAEFETFKATQAQLVTSRFVLAAALREPDLKGLPSVRELAAQHKALAWLTQNVQARFPCPNSAVLQVSVTGPDPREAAIVVNTVVRAYISEVVNAEQLAKKQRLDQLRAICAEKESQLRMKKKDLQQIAEVTKDSGQASGKRASIEVEMAQADVRRFEALLDRIAEERERLTVEMRAAPRVTVLGNADIPAEIPESAD